MSRTRLALTLLALTLVACSEAAAPPRPPAIQLSATNLSFSAVEGGANPAGQPVTVSNGGESPLAWSATANQGWLVLSPATGTAPSSVMVTPNVAGLLAGNHTASITIAASGATNSPQTVNVALTLAARPEITLSASTFTFTAQQNAGNPANQTLSISNTGGGTLNWTATDDAAWLTLSPASGAGAGTVALAVNTAGLSPGTHTATITVAATGASNTPRTATVTLTLTAAPSIALSPTSFNYTAQVGGPNPGSQTLNVSNGGGGTLSWTASDDASWLSLSPTSGTNAGSVTASVNTAGLAAGTYTAVITVSAPGAANTPATANVTLTLTQSYDGSWAGITAQDSTISFQVSGGGITTLTFGYRATGSGCSVNGKLTTTFTTPVAISNGSFSRSVSGSPTSYTIAGTFGSGTAASGTLNVTFSQSIPGQPSCSASGSTTWTASRQ